jgi:hypothetical protein
MGAFVPALNTIGLYAMTRPLSSYTTNPGPQGVGVTNGARGGRSRYRGVHGRDGRAAAARDDGSDRQPPHKREVRVVDYVDDQVPKLRRMFATGRKAYRAIGYNESQLPLGLELLADLGDAVDEGPEPSMRILSTSSTDDLVHFLSSRGLDRRGCGARGCGAIFAHHTRALRARLRVGHRGMGVGEGEEGPRRRPNRCTAPGVLAFRGLQ